MGRTDAIEGARKMSRGECDLRRDGARGPTCMPNRGKDVNDRRMMAECLGTGLACAFVHGRAISMAVIQKTKLESRSAISKLVLLSHPPYLNFELR